MATVYNDKMLDTIALACRPGTRQITLEGTIRSSKTVCAIEAFFWSVMFSTGKRHLLASYDGDTLKNNLLIADGFGLTTKFSKYCTEKKDRIGSTYIYVDSPNGKKRISLCTYANKSKWKDILGGNIEKILIDEANTADPQFINECYARQVSTDAPLTIYTLNGDVPTHSIYEKINCSKPLGRCPASIRAEIEKVTAKSGYFYTHWTLPDNPVMTPAKMAAAYTLYPVGSYYYTIKILGERGTPGKLIYADYMNESTLIQKLDISKYHSFIVSMDVGASRAQNSITLLGYTFGYNSVAVIDKLTFLQCGYKAKTEKLKAFIERCKNIGARYIECVVIDSAEQNYITDLKDEFRRLNLPEVIGSYKATIKDRIDLVIILMARGKFLFNETAEGKATYSAFMQATWEAGKEGEVRKDDNEQWNDILDGVEYGLTRHMISLLQSAKGAK